MNRIDLQENGNRYISKYCLYCRATLLMLGLFELFINTLIMLIKKKIFMKIICVWFESEPKIRNMLPTILNFKKVLLLQNLLFFIIYIFLVTCYLD